MVIRACANYSNYESIRKQVTERRQVLETARTMKIQRVQQDLEKIAKREREYARKLIEEIVPVKIEWNEDAWQRLQEILPIRVVDRSAAPPKPSPPVVTPTVVETDDEPPIA